MCSPVNSQPGGPKSGKFGPTKQRPGNNLKVAQTATKQSRKKVFSILQRAREAMDESYDFEQETFAPEQKPPPPQMDAYSGGGPSGAPAGRSNPQYEPVEFNGAEIEYEENPEFNREYYQQEMETYPGKSSIYSKNFSRF